MRARDDRVRMYEEFRGRGLAELLDEVTGDYGEYTFERERAWRRGHSHKYRGVGARCE